MTPKQLLRICPELTNDQINKIIEINKKEQSRAYMNGYSYGIDISTDDIDDAYWRGYDDGEYDALSSLS